VLKISKIYDVTQIPIQIKEKAKSICVLKYSLKIETSKCIPTPETFTIRDLKNPERRECLREFL